MPDSLLKKYKEKKEKITSDLTQAGKNDLSVKNCVDFLLQAYVEHYTVDTVKSHYISQVVDSFAYNDDSLIKHIGQNDWMSRLRNNRSDTIFDIEQVSNDDFTNNLEDAWQVKNTANWEKNIPEDLFRDYVLPSRVRDEDISSGWRQTLRNKYLGDGDINSIYGGTVEDAVARVHYMIYKKKKDFKILPPDQFPLPPLPVQILDKMNVGTCHELSILGACIMRSFGIPATVDFTPCYLSANNGHDWTVALTGHDRIIPFDITTSCLYNIRPVERKYAKVFRCTFRPATGHIEPATEKISADEPAFLNNPFVTDVTEQYTQTSNLSVGLDETELAEGDNAVFLSVFTTNGLRVVDKGMVKGSRGLFKNVGRGGLYICTQDGNSPVSAPFILSDSGELTFIHTNTAKPATITLYRKFPMAGYKKKWLERMVNGRFQVSEDSSFTNIQDIYTIKDTPDEHVQKAVFEKGIKARFIRYLSPDNSFGNVADIRFYSQTSKGLQLLDTGKVFGTATSLDPFTTRSAAVDRNELSFFHSNQADSSWVGVDLGKAQTINRIEYLPRNDMNSIQKGLTYELFYWDKGWNSLGEKKADTTYLIYTNVPENSLLRLKCSSGLEERPFTIGRHKEQVWW